MGVSKFSFYDNIMLALDGIINHSVVPLRVAIYVGIGVAAMTVLASAGYIVAYFTVGFRAPPGFTTITVLILGSLGINALLLGVIGRIDVRGTNGLGQSISFNIGDADVRQALRHRCRHGRPAAAQAADR